MHQPGLTLEPVQRQSYFNLTLSGVSDFLKAKLVVEKMNNPEHGAYIPDPNTGLNCTQLVDAKNDIERRKADIRVAAGALPGVSGITVLAAFDREFSRKMDLYDAAIQNCTPAPLPEIFAPTPTPPSTEPSTTSSPIIRLPSITEIKQGTSTLTNTNSTNNTQSPVQPAQSQEAAKPNNKKMALIIGTGVLLLIVITVIIIKKA